ncbi:acyl-CoA dehydrogenase, C-terminal domain protein [Bordetella holmesii 30539]|uniref:Acyl-CoA dehydrogenase, C-terminal domain protein n=1 Tax=Bordetella holmesii 1058 TaxID=1247648 RepID=A0ABN0S2L9_9BORD|nr:acyl-CoA dehydrogenase, C-terminal domain protein [Bordetella holmesii ATCC 51541]AIT25831.1 acyl-CoA dehydrogenase, C-terminal domain protein [Bordetella holmesii 44057]EWM43135.1 acyl-CoA dehydrogenase, C-terminal domain protein [Bordetella holmesii 41130]EWM46399.1 acyl-CoA dehydrogenase, C-terminal domain protein [Bordetella holmesii 35009]EWM50562.1 acyl-CoA dehydrogenase, C-terminal domain protein [Bordetella holmesii 70147]EXF89442.1 acyl-CoA dehydrogenase, C-terminal domain protein 
MQWPFLQERHRVLAQELEQWCQTHLVRLDETDVLGACQQLVRSLGQAGWLRYSVPGGPDGNLGGALPGLDALSLCVIRETLARHHALADFAFAMQGLGNGAISLAGSPQQQAAYLPAVAQGQKIAAFALSEPEAGSDVAALQCRAQAQGDSYRLDGTKTWISNGGLADFYCIFARTGVAGSSGISAFIVDADTPGLVVQEQIDVMSPHPLATLQLQNCRVPAHQRLGEEGQGFKIAMRTLDVFRTSVAAAAVGFARRALTEGLAHVRQRKMFGQTLADFQLTQAALGDAATEIDQSALLTYRAAWVRDVQQRSSTMETAMAKMAATESAQRVIDRVLQMFGGKGVVRGHILERLYRDIRSLRIYEGATEVQKLIISRELLRG